MIELSIIIPIFNEAAQIQHNALLVSKKLDDLKIPYEIILVNDGSTDTTLTLIEKLPKDKFKILSASLFSKTAKLSLCKLSL